VDSPLGGGAEPFKLGQRRGLDGLRGFAIVLVILSHIPKFGLGGGFIGVDVFFVLSGFLITTLLLEEWRETGGISLGAFYARRALRLLPALILMLLAVVVVSAWTEPRPAAGEMRMSALMTLLYSANWFLAYRAYPRLELSPTWSLSVEEQYYIVWPVLLVLLLRMKWSKRAIAAFVIAAILASVGTRAWLWSTTGSFERVFFGSDTHADGLLLGSLAGLLLSWGACPRSAALIRGFNWSAHLALGFFAVFLFIGWPADPYLFQGGYLALNLGATALLLCLISSPWPALRLLFESAPLVWVGRVSYGLYLWHIGAFWILSRTPWSGGNRHWPLAVALTFAAASASYYGLERPILKLKRRFERVPSRALRSP
jgi:peptidoglycan/LPS O-acetylase OafA/YrhL